MPIILAIDDKQDNLITISALFKNFIPDCTVITSDSGAEGIKKAETEQPDTILLDIKMPEMDGFEVCRRLKSNEKTKHIPIIMVTAIKTDSKSRVKGLELGADAFLSKPIDETELAAQVKVVLRIKTAEDLLRKEKDLLEDTVRERSNALLEGEKKYKAIFSNAQVALFRTRISDGKILEINKRYANMTGYSNIDDCIAEFVIADAWADPNVRDELLKILKEKGSVNDYEEEFIIRDGTRIWVSFSATIFPEQGCLEGSIVDINDRKQAEVALRQSEERYRTLIETITDMIFIISPNGNLTYVNPEFEKLTGFPVQDSIERSFTEVLAPEYIESTVDRFKRGLSGETIPVYEVELKHKDGKTVPVELKVT